MSEEKTVQTGTDKALFSAEDVRLQKGIGVINALVELYDTDASDTTAEMLADEISKYWEQIRKALRVKIIE
jgi:hypothetical protein